MSQTKSGESALYLNLLTIVYNYILVLNGDIYENGARIEEVVTEYGICYVEPGKIRFCINETTFTICRSSHTEFVGNRPSDSQLIELILKISELT